MRLFVAEPICYTALGVVLGVVVAAVASAVALELFDVEFAR